MGRMAAAARVLGLLKGRGLQRFQQLQAHRGQVARRQVRPRLGQLRRQQRHLGRRQYPLDQPGPVVRQCTAVGLLADESRIVTPG